MGGNGLLGGGLGGGPGLGLGFFGGMVGWRTWLTEMVISETGRMGWCQPLRNEMVKFDDCGSAV